MLRAGYVHVNVAKKKHRDSGNDTFHSFFRHDQPLLIRRNDYAAVVNGLLRNGKNCINLTVRNSLRQPINQNLKSCQKA
jgi:hypothetical protein